jgi:hypothetical protein
MDSTYINVTNTTGLFYPNLESVGGHARLFADGNPDLPPSWAIFEQMIGISAENKG